MEELRLNDAQKSAIEKQGSNILVSAAAGSGKTTVLVERVLKKIIEDGVSIDDLIIMTFTRAAAASMKEKIHGRIRQAIADTAKDASLNEHLRRQLMKIHSARISTIDSLCLDIVKDHFQYLDLDPTFRIADEAELRMLQTDLLQAFLEEKYQDPDEDFLTFVSYYTDKSDAKIETLILDLYTFAQSHPDPNGWLKRAVLPYSNAARCEIDPDTEGNAWMATFEEIVRSKVQSAVMMCREGLSLCNMELGPEKYRSNFEPLLPLLEELAHSPLAEMGTKMAVALDNWKRLASQSEKDVDARAKVRAKDLYGEIRQILQDLGERYFYRPYEDLFADMGKSASVAAELALLTQEFSDRFKEVKKEKKIAGFSDVAHYAIDVLVQYDEEGNPHFTETADLLAQNTNEIIVDEYQDTNHLQEVLISALSAERFGRPDVFMVGDVKQSIYAFRLACPDLFLEKYNAYGKQEGGERIIFDKNYRSRQEVIDFTNFIFRQIMIPEVGSIDYADGNALDAGREDAQAEVPYDAQTEIVMIEGSGETAKLAESYEITTRIEQLVAEGHFTYGDIAILCRTSEHPQLERMLADRKIPVVKASGKGFFDTLEVKLTLNLLRIIDNPYQNIPFTAVLTSPIVGLSANDLAMVKTRYTDEPFCVYEACRQSADGDERLATFLSKYETWRTKSGYLGIVSFLETVLDDSGLYHMIMAMPQGEQRKANMDFLKSLAISFSNSSYSGLFHFIRYIEEMQKNEMDFGQAQTPDADQNAVQLMTIHKSKGLEFPVVFLADAGKKYNENDFKEPIILDAELGIGLEYRNIEEKTKRRTILMETIREQKKRDLYAEEMRLLYVALTRAKEKLIITGSKNGQTKRWENWDVMKAEERPVSILSSEAIMKNNCHMYLLGDCLTAAGYDNYLLTQKTAEYVEAERAEEIFSVLEKKDMLTAVLSDSTKPDDETTSLRKELEESLQYVYPFEKATHTQVKLSASQLNEIEEVQVPSGSDEGVSVESEAGGPAESEAAGPEEVLEFNGYEKCGMQIGSERGTAYHKVFELLDLCNVDVAGQINNFVQNGYLTSEQAAYVKAEDIKGMLSSPLGQRMKKAYEAGTLRREQQFVMGVEENGELRLIQGIIDAFFEEDGEYVLVDYKTDKQTDEVYFISGYRKQQKAYKDAIEKATGKHVKEAYLYSTALSREILLPF